MCGILGGVSRASDGFNEAALRQSLVLLRHRGPDAEGLHREPGLFLGHRRLSILDLDRRADQPMSRGHCVLTFNGEIYNYRELRRELEGKGHTFTTTSDTEVLVNAYLEYGRDCLEKIEGMFAFAVWDRNRRCLFLARDRFGEKPLFHYRDSEQFLFASEIPPLAHLLDPTRLEEDPQTVGLYFLFSYIPAPFAPYRRMGQLEPGCWLEFDPQTWSSSLGRYFALRDQVSGAGTPAEHNDYQLAVRVLKTRIEENVQSRLAAADVPVATLLSGGLDSSIITATAAASYGRPITAYSLGFPEEPEFDETPYARLLAQTLPEVRHRVVPATEERMLDTAGKILESIGEPYADASLVPTSYLCAHVDEKVVLGGDGADELFAGYGVYPALVLSKRLPRWLKSVLTRLPRSGNPQAIRRPSLRALGLFHAHLRVDPVDEYLGWRAYAKPQLLTDLGLDLGGLEGVRERLAYVAHGDLSTLQMADFDFNLPNDMLKKVDYASMLHGLEVRLPYLDSTLVRWVLSLPASFRMRAGARKRMLRDAFAAHLPSRILQRRKHGFLLPIRKWLRDGRLRDEMDVLVHDQRIFDPCPLRMLLDRHATGAEDHGVLLWAIYVYLKWAQRIAARSARSQGFEPIPPAVT